MTEINRCEEVANVLPATFCDALVYAGRARDIKFCDKLTDELARLGICRPRAECRPRYEIPVFAAARGLA